MSQGAAPGVAIILPSLKISGGIREALRLAQELRNDASTTQVLSLWSSPHPMAASVPVVQLSKWAPRAAWAAFELPFLQLRFWRWLRKQEEPPRALIFTHYATLPLALLVPRHLRYFFVQGVEWNFLRSRILSSVLRQIVVRVYRTGKIISANPFLSDQLGRAGLRVAFEAPIWADEAFLGRVDEPRDIDFAMVLRKGAVKRLDLYQRFVDFAQERGMKLLIITPDDELAHGDAAEILLRPSAEQMRRAYERSKAFVLLSESEGFGLPPLEAMGSGCVPVCRDSGGVRAFMADSELKRNLLDLEMSVEQIFDHAMSVISNDAQWRNASRLARARFEAGLHDGAEARRRLVESMLPQAES